VQLPLLQTPPSSLHVRFSQHGWAVLPHATHVPALHTLTDDVQVLPAQHG
jgi:hypothetical protein